MKYLNNISGKAKLLTSFFEKCLQYVKEHIKNLVVKSILFISLDLVTSHFKNPCFKKGYYYVYHDSFIEKSILS
jgi:hypothetical protein